jgi:hypothetical protein
MKIRAGNLETDRPDYTLFCDEPDSNSRQLTSGGPISDEKDMNMEIYRHGPVHVPEGSQVVVITDGAGIVAKRGEDPIQVVPAPDQRHPDE